jgi:hypothetical protein
MPETALSLGPIVFRDFEIPSAITFGGRQRLATHYLSTGRRVTDVLGPDDATIIFTGVLSGALATQRAREIDTLRSLGQPLTLAWNSFSYLVIIGQFRAEYRNQWWVPYTISCAVLENPITAGLLSALSATAEALVGLNLMYAAVPATLLPFPDPRGAIPANPASFTRTQAATTVSELEAAAAILATQRQKREVRAGNLSIGQTMPLGSVASDLFTMVSIAGDLQFLALAQDCLGQVRALLSQPN